MAEQNPILTELNVTSEVSVNVTSNGTRSRLILENVLGEEHSSEYKTAVLLQISHCLSRLEINQTPLDELLPSNIFIGERELANESISSTGLARTFFRILTGRDMEVGLVILTGNDCEDYFTAQDLIEQMNSDDFTINEVLHHPFFWSKREKINFICKSYDRLDQRNENLKKMMNDNTNHVIPQNTGWIEELRLSEPELEYLDENYPNVAISEETLYSYRNVNFDETLILELMRYFRNRHTHYWEDNIKIRTAFGDHNTGYWEFYQRRFPKLLMHVYQIIVDQFPTDEEEAPFKYLPRTN